MVNVILTNQHIIASVDNDVVSDSENYLTAKFYFSKIWDGYTKTAIYKNGTTIREVLLTPQNTDFYITENEYIIPNEVIKSVGFTISIAAVKDNILLTSDVAFVRCEQSGYIKGKTPDAPDQTIYQQLLNTTKPPYIGKNGNWYEINTTTKQFIDTGFKAKGDKGDTPAVDQIVTPTSQNAISSKGVYDFVNKRDTDKYVFLSDIDVAKAKTMSVQFGATTKPVLAMTIPDKISFYNVVIIDILFAGFDNATIPNIVSSHISAKADAMISEINKLPTKQDKIDAFDNKFASNCDLIVSGFVIEATLNYFNNCYFKDNINQTLDYVFDIKNSSFNLNGSYNVFNFGGNISLSLQINSTITDTEYQSDIKPLLSAIKSIKLGFVGIKNENNLKYDLIGE